MTSDYIPAALAILAGVGFALLLTAAAKYLGPHRPSKAKDYPYECGSDVIGSPRARFSVKFYQVAILFLVFDIETAFLYPWALRYRELSCPGRSTTGVCSGRHLVLRPRRDAGVHGHPGRRARLRLAKARDRMGVDAWDSSTSYTTKLRGRRQLGAQVLAVPVPVRHRVLRHGVHVASRRPKYDIARFGAEFPRFSPRQADLLIVVGTITEKQGPALAPHLRADVRAQVGHRLRRLRVDRRLLPELLDDAGRRSGHPGRRLHPRLPAAPRAGARRADLLQDRIQSGEGHSQLASRSARRRGIAAKPAADDVPARHPPRRRSQGER